MKRPGYTQHHFFQSLRRLYSQHRQQKGGAGYTLVELLVYLGLSSLVLLLMTGFLARVMGNKAIAATQTQLQENERTVFDAMTVAIRNSYEVTVENSGTKVIVKSHPEDSGLTTYTVFQVDAHQRLSMGQNEDFMLVDPQPITDDGIIVKAFSATVISSSLEVTLVIQKGTQTNAFTSTIAFRQQ